MHQLLLILEAEVRDAAGAEKYDAPGVLGDEIECVGQLCAGLQRPQ
ncbi:hypothetical protein [Nocardia sp. CA-120079]